MIIKETKNWRIELDAEEEDVHPDESYVWMKGEREEFFANVVSGKWLWFSAKITVDHKATGLTLGTSYLGACCYESLEDFAQPGGYVRSMTSEAISEARNNMKRLTT